MKISVTHSIRRFVPLFMALATAVFAVAEDILLYGHVKDAVTKFDLTDAYVILYDSLGNVKDSIQANKGMKWSDTYGDEPTSDFSFRVERKDSTYVFDVCCEGYETKTEVYALSKIGKRERYRQIPITYLKRAPKMLDELTVTATKVKFYNKGDTIVYNADAFQLAEGSMLDALVAQLPGAELSTDGQIKINGQFVESLLLNGKEFFDGNNNLMLENIGAYTVKDIQVYDGQKKKDQLQGNIAGPKVLTMDVRLKKEYMGGVILNAQGGYGTENRYIGRLFASTFTATTQLAFIANANNLNDNRTPGRDDSWTPEALPSGRKEYLMGGFNYNYENPEETTYASGNIRAERTINKVSTTTDRINFLPGGDTYDYSYSDNHQEETRVNTDNYFQQKFGQFGIMAGLEGFYDHSKNFSSYLSGTFSSHPTYMNSEILDALYSDGSQELLESVINRSRTRSDGWKKTWGGGGHTGISYTIPRSEDRLYLNFGGSYQSDKEELWNDYDINFGDNPASAVRRRHFTDNTPSHNRQMRAAFGYHTGMKGHSININYRFEHSDIVKDSYMYALDRLEDMGAYGVVPSGYLAVLDPANSYTSKIIENSHKIEGQYNFFHRFKDNKSWISSYFMPSFSLTHRHLDYWRGGVSQTLSKTNALLTLIHNYAARISYQFGASGDPNLWDPKYELSYSFMLQPTLPEMTDMVEMTNDADPLNIFLGNPDLKTETKLKHSLTFQFSPPESPVYNSTTMEYERTSNALTRGYTYDTSTGIRINRMYNVQGNDRIRGWNDFSLQFGPKRQFTFGSYTYAAFARYADMIGVNLESPEQSKVRNRSLTENLKLGWQFAGQSLSLRGDFTNRRTTSSQEGFSTLNANHFNYGLSGVFKLPAGFGVSTDFTCYMRRGYGTKELDTTDPIWNARLTYCPPRANKWVFTLDGFDLLHKLNNVNYAVNAAGRTVSYTNSLPRYVLFTVQYRISLQPKRH